MRGTLFERRARNPYLRKSGASAYICWENGDSVSCGVKASGTQILVVFLSSLFFFRREGEINWSIPVDAGTRELELKFMTRVKICLNHFTQARAVMDINLVAPTTVTDDRFPRRANLMEKSRVSGTDMPAIRQIIRCAAASLMYSNEMNFGKLRADTRVHICHSSNMNFQLNSFTFFLCFLTIFVST